MDGPYSLPYKFVCVSVCVELNLQILVRVYVISSKTKSVCLLDSLIDVLAFQCGGVRE